MSSSIADNTPRSFLEGGGEMGERIRGFDWASTPLGPPESWPTQLKTMVRLLLTTHHPMFIFWGPDLIQFYNDAYRRSLGPERHPGALGQRGRECWEEIWPIIGPQIALVMEGRGSTWHEDQLVPTTRHGKHEDVYWTYSYSPIDEPDAAHGVGGVLVVCSETSERVIAGRGHLAERDRLQQLFQQAPGFMAMLRGPHHVIEMANPAYLRLVGDRDMLGRTVADAMPEAAEQGYVDLLDEVYRSGKAYSATSAKYRVAGAANAPAVEHYVDFVYQPVTDRDGHVTGIFIEGFDVTGAHADAAAVRELYATLEQRVADTVAQRNILADVVEFADAFILVVDLQYRILAVNKASADIFQRVYGHRPQVGDNLLAMMEGDPLRRARSRAYWERVMGGEDFHVAETFQAPDKEMRHYDVRFNVLRDRSGSQVGAFVVSYDVTERTREQARLAEAEERVRQAQKMETIGQLTGGIAQDFNNLLTVISGGLEVMDTLAPERRDKIIAGMRLAVDRGAGLSRQLLAFSRRQPLRPEPLGVARCIGGMRDMLHRSLGGNIQVEVAFERGLWAIEVDPRLLELVMLNLAVNARDAMPGGGTITIRARNAPGLSDEELRGDYVELSVADTGTGMMPEVLARVFEPFFTTKEIGKGSGLGLAQAHGFAYASGGAARIESEPRRGTTVFLYLPRAENFPAALGHEPDEATPGNEGVVQGALLLVEDDDEVAALTTEMLRSVGYDVTRVENAEAALGALANGREIDIVFSDVMMPGKLDGIDLLQELKRRHPLLPVVLTSGYVDAVRQEAESIGVQVLPKPYRLKDLETALNTARRVA